MRRAAMVVTLGVIVVAASNAAVWAQGPSPAANALSSPATSGAEVLKGSWVRPDGGYTIVIKGVGADGKLDAMYFNPNPLPFAKAQAVRDGTTLRAFFELQAGGYAGSTYELTYDPAADRLKGIYYQAVARQKFDIHFVRK
jgi:hypothetical protein